MLQIALSLIFFIKMYRQLCSIGCLQCDDNDNCLICDASSLYVKMENTCIQNVIPNCQLSFFYNICAQCFPGYYLEINHKCVQNAKVKNQIANCKKYSRFTKCVQCEQNFYLDEKGEHCIKIEQKIQGCMVYGKEGVCLVCKDGLPNKTGNSCNEPSEWEDHCMFYSNSTVCVQCQDQYKINTNAYIENFSNYYQQYILGLQEYYITKQSILNISQCIYVELVEHCLKYDSELECIQCEDGYYYETQNKLCNPNPPFVAQKEYEILNCQMKKTTTQIINGVSYETTICQLCYKNYYIEGNGKVCKRHDVEPQNCLILSQSKKDQCLSCSPQYYLETENNQNVCILRKDSPECAEPDPITSACKTCKNSNAIKHFNDQICSPPISDCEDYDKSGEILQCLVCKQGFYYNTKERTCDQIGEDFDPYCQRYNSDKSCSQCINKYYYSSIAQNCQPNDEEYLQNSNCLLYSQSNQNTCVKCQSSYSLIDINNSCKIPSLQLGGDKGYYNKIINCDQFQIDESGAYTCIRSILPVARGKRLLTDNSEFFGDQEELEGLYTNIYHYYINAEKLVSYVDDDTSIEYCIKYANKLNRDGKLECLKCQTKLKSEVVFEIDDIYDVSPSWCQNNLHDKYQVCLNPIGVCGMIYFLTNEQYDAMQTTDQTQIKNNYQQNWYALSTCLEYEVCKTMPCDNSSDEIPDIYYCPSCYDGYFVQTCVNAAHYQNTLKGASTTVEMDSATISFIRGSNEQFEHKGCYFKDKKTIEKTDQNEITESRYNCIDYQKGTYSIYCSLIQYFGYYYLTQKLGGQPLSVVKDVKDALKRTDELKSQLDNAADDQQKAVKQEQYKSAVKQMIMPRTFSYDLQLTEDKLKCQAVKTFEIVDNCYEFSGESCNLCETGYYPSKTSKDFYYKQTLEAYKQIQDKVNMNMCITYDATGAICLECGYGNNAQYRLNEVNSCIQCDPGVAQKYTDISETSCIQTTTKQEWLNNCYKVDTKNTTLMPGGDSTNKKYFCTQCLDGYMPVLVYDQYPEGIKEIIQRIYIKKGLEDTRMYKDYEMYQIDSCILKTSYISPSQVTQDEQQHCSLAYKDGENYYCAACEFFYEGQVQLTSNGKGAIVGCKKMESNKCNQNIFYVIPDKNLRMFASCHQCVDSNQMPTLVFYFSRLNGLDSEFVISNLEEILGDDITKYGFNCYKKGTTVLSCAIQFYDSNESSHCLNKVVLSSSLSTSEKQKQLENRWLCLACLPGNYPAYKDCDQKEYFPFHYVLSCASSGSCESSVLNECEVCNDSSLDDKNQVCETIENSKGDTDLSQCKRFNPESGYCKECKNQSYLKKVGKEAKECTPIDFGECEYFQGDECVQIKNQHSVNGFVIVRTKVEYDVDFQTCQQIPELVDNCLFYSSDKKCFQCQKNYQLLFNGSVCMKDSDYNEYVNCKEFDETKSSCLKCQKTSQYPNTSISSSSLDKWCFDISEDTAKTIAKCNYEQAGYCYECKEGFYPVDLKSISGNVCLNYKYDPLCKEIDKDLFQSTGVLACSQCYKINEINQMLSDKKMKLQSYQFIYNEDYQSYINNNSQLKFTYDNEQDLQNILQYLRPSLLSKSNIKYCLEFGGEENCEIYDNENFSKTYKCIQCNIQVAYLNISSKCQKRLQEFKNCAELSPSSDQCNKYNDINASSSTYSALDILTLENTIEEKTDTITEQKGINHCSKFSDESTCIECDETTYLYDNLCISVSQQIFKCKRYQWDYICSECQEGYILYQNKCIAPKAKNCQSYLTPQKCLRCQLEYPYLLPDGSCSQHPDIKKCVKMQNPTKCLDCEQGYYNDNGNCVFSGKQIENCESQLANNLCRKCALGYYVSEDMTSCVPNPFYDKHCQQYESQSICIMCQENYYMKKHQCVECKTNENECLFCNPENPSQCLICKPGFYMNKSKICQAIKNYQNHLITLYKEDIEAKENSDSA